MKICVFLSGCESNDPLHKKATKELGEKIATKNHELIYGGTKVGLMKVLADEALKCGGKVTGIISKEFDKPEITHNKLTELFVVEDMSERIKKQIEISDIFVTMPGGIGTFDEFFKIWVLNKTKQIKKPLIILNINNFFDPLIKQIHDLNKNGMIGKSEVDLVNIYDNVEKLFDFLQQ